MSEEGAVAKPNGTDWDRSYQVPKVSDALRNGARILVTTWGGRELSGLVCDREPGGLLLDVSEADAESGEYVFLPWSSIEQVVIRGLTQRQVKFLQG
jgi:hypothetical protein